MDKICRLGNFAQTLGCEVRYDEPMSRHTTFKIGGGADLFIAVNSADSLQKLCREALKSGVPVFPIGNGSNILVSDGGIRGAVITFGGELKKIVLLGDTAIECGAGVPLAALCGFAKDRSLSGLEFAWGIPGTAGGAAFMNAGAYGHSMSEVLVSCSHVTKSGEAGALAGEGLELGYRRSAYADNGCMITSIRLKLKKGNTDKIAADMAELYERRKAKQPLELPSAGSVFKRPQGNFAGALIEQCGLKGRSVGGAAVSEKHAGFIVNTGGATCADVRNLIEIIEQTVFSRTGVQLECEVKLIG